ncbi:hypothetical protein HZS_1261 [Henneguya salminicola]|nr:hypothetical protein HZS_1261 [Henneguya salminicola]
MHLYIKKESYGFGLKIIVSSEFFFAIVVLLITCIFAENCPKTPPSKSECTIEEGMEAMSNKETMIFLIKQTMSLFKNIKISIFLIIYGVYYANTAITSMFLTEMNDFFNKDTNRISGYIGACCTLMGAFGTLFFAALVGKFGPKYNKHFSSYINFVCSLMTIVIIFINQKGLNNNYTIFVSMLLLGFHSDAFCSLGFEMLANISYPVQSNVSANAGLLVGNLIGAVLIPIFGIFSNHNKYLISLIFTASAYALNSILLTFLHFQNKRLHVDNEVMTTLT